MTYRFTSDIHEHAWSVVAGSYHEAQRQKALFADRKFSQILFGRYFGFEKMTQLCFASGFQALRSATHLDLIESISRKRWLYLNNLNTVELYDGHWHSLSPSVEHSCHAQLHSQSAYPPQSLLPCELSNCWQTGINLIGVVAIDGLELSWTVISSQGGLLNRQVLKVVNCLSDFSFCFCWSSPAFVAGGEVHLLIILDVLQLGFCLKLLQRNIVSADNLFLSADLINHYMVSFSIFSASIAFILFSCSCSDLDSLAAFSSPTANERANSASLGLALGLDHLEKASASRLVMRNMIMVDSIIRNKPQTQISNSLSHSFPVTYAFTSSFTSYLSFLQFSVLMSFNPRSQFSQKVLGRNSILRRVSSLGWKGLEKKEWERGSTRIMVKGRFPFCISSRSCRRADMRPLNSVSLSTKGLLSSK